MSSLVVSEPQSTLSTDAIRQYTALGGLNSDTIQRLFSLFILDIETNQVISAPELDPSKTRATAEYFFRVPPKSFEIGEPMSTHIVPTQNNGMFIESHGNIFKQIKLQGTTGLRPNKGSVLPDQIPLLSAGVDNIVQTFSTSPLAAQSLPATEVTGHDDIIFLRNMFRHFSDQIKLSNRKIAMVFRNVRDDDYWVVEPEDFRLSRSSSSPLTYEYSIVLRGIAKHTQSRPIPDPLDRYRAVNRFASRVQLYTQALSNSFFLIGTQVTRATSLGFFGINTTLGTVSKLIQALQYTKDNYEAVSNVKDLTRQLKQEIKDGWEKLTGKVPAQDQLIRCLHRVYVVCCKIETEQPIRDSIASNLTTTQNRINNAYNGKNPTTEVGNTVSQATVNFGEDIRAIAKRLMGSVNAWRALVELNGLRPPYISHDQVVSQPGVLQTGDTILYPSRNSRDADINNVVSASKKVPDDTTASTENTSSPIVAAYGRDIRVVGNVAGQDVFLTDFKVNQRGDVSTIAGIPNVEQAVKIKFATEQGELPKHPTFGALYSIGSKMNLDSFNTFRLNTLSTFYSDSRIKNVSGMRFVSSGDVLAVSATLQLTDSKNYLSTDFALRRF